MVDSESRGLAVLTHYAAATWCLRMRIVICFYSLDHCDHFIVAFDTP